MAGRSELDATLIAISTEFVSLPSDRIDAAIAGVLARVGVALDVDRVIVFARPPAGGAMAGIYGWVRPGVQAPPLRTDVPLRPLPYYQQLIDAHGVVRVDDVRQLPESAEAERAGAEVVGARALLGAPMLVGRTQIGSVGAYSLSGPHAWSGEAITFLRLLAHVLANALDRVRRHRALSESEARFRALVDASFTGVCVSVDAIIVDANDALCQLTGYDHGALIGLSPRELTDAPSAARVHNHIAAGDEAPYRVTIIRQDGSRFPAELVGRSVTWQGKPARVTGFRDLSGDERSDRLEEQLQRAQKLETLGVMVGGIAHDFNNLLLGILGNAELLREELQDEAHRLRVDRILSVGRRAGSLTQQLLAYAGQRSVEPRAVDLATLVRETADLTGSGLTRQVPIEVRVEAGTPPVWGDPGQVQQVVLNLLTNAVEAMGGREGRVRVCLGRWEMDPDVLAHAWLDATDDSTQDSGFLCLRVQDDGTGMDAATLGRLFDPFFTTKFAGRGLGLAAVLGIVRAHHGAIHVESKPGVGSVFTLILPAAKPAGKPVATARPARQGSGTVLVVDDEPELRRLCRFVLERTGFSVLEAHDGPAALEVFGAHPEVAVVVLDLTMPGMSGLEVLDALRACRPDLPVLMVSGHARREVLDRSDVLFLPKPYPISQLRDLVIDLVEGAVLS